MASELILRAPGRIKYFMGCWTVGLTSLLAVEIHLHNWMNDNYLSGSLFCLSVPFTRTMKSYKFIELASTGE